MEMQDAPQGGYYDGDAAEAADGYTDDAYDDAGYAEVDAAADQTYSEALGIEDAEHEDADGVAADYADAGDGYDPRVEALEAELEQMRPLQDAAELLREAGFDSVDDLRAALDEQERTRAAQEWVNERARQYQDLVDSDRMSEDTASALLRAEIAEMQLSALHRESAGEQAQAMFERLRAEFPHADEAEVGLLLRAGLALPQAVQYSHAGREALRAQAVAEYLAHQQYAAGMYVPESGGGASASPAPDPGAHRRSWTELLGIGTPRL